MKTRILIIIGIVGVIILGSGSYVYSQMHDCLNPPPWMKIPYFGFENCFQMFINGNLPDWTLAKEEHEKSLAPETFSESERPSGKPSMSPVLISTNGTGHVTIWPNSFLYAEIMCPTDNPYPANYQILFEKVPYDTKVHGVKQVNAIREHVKYNGFVFDLENPSDKSETATIKVNCSINPEPRTEPDQEPIIIEDGTDLENTTPYTSYEVSGFKQTYMVGEPISFIETIQGFDNPCVYPHFEILDGNTLESVWEYKMVFPCPFTKEPQQFKKIDTIPNEKIPSPMMNQTGQYIFRSYHSYSDDYTEVKFSVVDLDMDSGKPSPDSGSLFIPEGHVLGDAHEHASILVKIYGDKFDFSHPQYQVRSSWIHFEGLDGNTIHRHSKGITLGYLFDTLDLKLSSECFVFVDGREFCTNQEDSLKFYINGIQAEDIRDYVISQGDRILISYGPEDTKEIQEQLDELNTQEIIN